MNDIDTTPQPTLWNRHFVTLWLSLIQSNFGDAFLAVGALWLVYQMTGSAFAASTILILEGLPKLLGLVAGAVIDRSDKKKLLISVDVFRGVLLVFAYGLHWFSTLQLWHIYAVVALLNAASVFYTPTVRSVLPNIVPNDQLPRANALVQTGQQAAKIIGAGLAGWVLAYAQSPFALFVDGLSFLIAALAVCFIALPHSQITQKRNARQLLADVGAGVKFITTSREMSSLLFVVALVNLILGPVNVALPIFSSQVLGDGVISLGYLEAALAGGMLFGGLVVGAVLGERLKYPHIITVGILGLALALLGLGMVRTLTPAIIATAAFTSFIPLLSIGLHTRVQRLVPLDFRGRVFASIDMIGNIALPIGALIAGGLLERLLSSQVFSLGAVCVGITALVWIGLSARNRFSTSTPDLASATPNPPNAAKLAAALPARPHLAIMVALPVLCVLIAVLASYFYTQLGNTGGLLATVLTATPISQSPPVTVSATNMPQIAATAAPITQTEPLSVCELIKPDENMCTHPVVILPYGIGRVYASWSPAIVAGHNFELVWLTQENDKMVVTHRYACTWGGTPAKHSCAARPSNAIANERINASFAYIQATASNWGNKLPANQYQVELRIDGKVLAQQAFRVVGGN